MKKSLNDQIAERILKALNRSKTIERDTARTRVKLVDWRDSNKRNKDRIDEVIARLDAISEENAKVEEEIGIALGAIAETGEIEMDLVSGLGNVAMIANNWRIFAAGDPDYLLSVIIHADDETLKKVVGSLPNEKKEIVRQCLLMTD